MRLQEYINARLKQHPMLLMTHLVVGYPSLDDNWRMLESMQRGGVDLVELQFPFSEPIADGPLFIHANQQALSGGLHRDDYFELLSRAADSFDFPLLFMGYYNTVLRMGHAAFCRSLAHAGGSGMIIADLPPEHAADLLSAARPEELDFVRLMTPTDTDARLREIGRDATGFIYCVARKGVTGKATSPGQGVREYLERCRAATQLPIGIGFGIRNAEDVLALHGAADIAIVGSACLDAWERGGESGYDTFIASLAQAAHGAVDMETN